MTESVPLKALFGLPLAQTLAERIRAVHPAFPAEPFLSRLAEVLPPLELKQRVGAIAAALRASLPDFYDEALAILLPALGPSPEEGPAMFADTWYAWPLATFVELYGLEYPHASLAALHAITQRSTAEFAIRPYILRYPELTLQTLHAWAGDPSFHVRRLVSEGTRPRLPWAPRLPAFVADPTPVLELLERLRDDPSAYVRRSVANNLNDITRDHPERVVITAQRWMDGATPERERLVRHALRTLIKQGHPGALELIGATHGAQVALERFAVAPERLAIGASVQCTATLRSTAALAQHLVVDYVMHFAGANGALRRKVFKLRTADLAPGETLGLQWSHSFRQRTTRRHYPGRQLIELQVNGVIVGEVDVWLDH
jgi:3-methyladenine DNA glycosylase AlkC